MWLGQERLLGTVQVDVDELWVYYDSIGRETPSNARDVVYDQGVPRLLDLFDRFGIRATFFVCGFDVPAHTDLLREMARRGHEVANHSHGHRMGYARLSREEKRADITRAGDLIADATGQRPVGFKAPGFSFSADLLDVLGTLGYLYDSSLLPTPYAGLLRRLQQTLSHGHVDPTHYGRAIHGLAPLRPYRPDPAAPHRPRGHRRADGSVASLGNPVIWEAPVTTIPFVRLPMHSTFVLSSSRLLFDSGLALARRRRVPINYLLHAADTVDLVRDPALASYAFLNRSWGDKRPLYEHMLRNLAAAYRLVPTRELVEDLGEG